VNYQAYVEFAPASDLAEYVQSVWFRSVSPAEADHPARVVPDGCMDLIWMESGLIVAGPDTRAWNGPLASGDEIVGLRFRPGMAAPLLGLPATELVDWRTALKDVSPAWADQLNRAIKPGFSAQAVRHALQASLRDRLRGAPEYDRAVRHVAVAIQSAGGENPVRVDQLAEAVGLSERQLHRRCREAFGYGPKLLARIVRFQRFLKSADAAWIRPIAHLAADCGYADQAHLTREVKQLSGLPPARLLAERKAARVPGHHLPLPLGEGWGAGS
jgi:AraC-like DNA-binding protein